jgi:hypothetical protein
LGGLNCESTPCRYAVLLVPSNMITATCSFSDAAILHTYKSVGYSTYRELSNAAKDLPHRSIHYLNSDRVI